MRRNSTPAITAKMYRDFAVTTVAITALIALFAGGERDDAVAAEAHPSAEATQAADAGQPRKKPEPAEEDVGSWGTDVDFGRPSGGGAFDAGAWTPSDGPWQPDLPAPIANPQGPPGLTAGERDELARAAARSAAAQPAADDQG